MTTRLNLVKVERIGITFLSFQKLRLTASAGFVCALGESREKAHDFEPHYVLFIENLKTLTFIYLSVHLYFPYKCKHEGNYSSKMLRNMQ